MANVRYRENTFKIDLANFSKRPSFEELHTFVHDIIGLQTEQVKRLQMNHAQNCAHVRCVDLKTALDVVDQHNNRHELNKIKVHLAMDDGGVEVKIHDLSENVTDDEITNHMEQFGEVLSIKELKWAENFAFKGVPTGIKVVKMMLRKHIKSFITIQGEQTLVTYRNQPPTCRHCNNAMHPGTTCVQNKKLIGQKNDLDKRLKDAQKHSASYKTLPTKSYASVAGNKANTLMPNFATLTPAQSAQETSQYDLCDLTPVTASERSLPPAESTQIIIELEEDKGPHNGASNLDGVVEETHAEKISKCYDTENEPIAVCSASTKSVSKSKIPNHPLPLHSVMQISGSDSSESSSEYCIETRNAKRSRTRNKKMKLEQVKLTLK